MTKSGLISFICVLLCVPVGWTQEPAATFRTGTTLVEFTVVALDRKGQAVADLKQEELEVFDGGKKREVAFFRFEGNAERPGAELVESYRNRGDVLPVPVVRNVTALVVDTVNTSPKDQMVVKAQALKLLQALAPQSRVAVYQLGREFRVLHDFSDDMESLRARLEKLQVEFSKTRAMDIEQLAGEMEAVLGASGQSYNIYRVRAARALENSMRARLMGEVNANARVRETATQDALAALTILGQHMSGIPGRKSLVWITGGASMSFTTMSMGGPVKGTSVRSLEGRMTQVAQLLAQSGVALYAVDARGVQSGAENLSEQQDIRSDRGRYSEEVLLDRQNSDVRAGLTLLTKVTGGRAFFNANDLSIAVRQAGSDQKGSYTVAFYAPEDAAGKWRPLKVSTTRGDVELRYKEGYFPEKPEAVQPGWNEAALNRALRDPRGSQMVGVEADAEPGTQPGELKLRVRVRAQDLTAKEEAGKFRTAFEIVLAKMAVDGRSQYEQASFKVGVPAAQWRGALETGLPWNKTITVDETTLTVRLLVRDVESGRYGTLDVPAMQILTHAPKVR